MMYIFAFALGLCPPTLVISGGTDTWRWSRQLETIRMEVGEAGREEEFELLELCRVLLGNMDFLLLAISCLRKLNIYSVEIHHLCFCYSELNKILIVIMLSFMDFYSYSQPFTYFIFFHFKGNNPGLASLRPVCEVGVCFF